MSAGHIVVINDASIAKGGATSLALLSVRLLHEQGVRVTYIAGDDGENSALHDLDINVVAVGGTHLVAQSKAKSLLGGIHNPSTVDRLTQWIKENDKPDTVYHVHGWSKILSPSLFAALGSVAARTVVHAHDFFMACPNGGMMNYKTMELCQKTPMSIDCILTNCDKRSYPQKLWRVARQRSLRRKVSPPGPWAQILMIHEKMLPTLVSAGYDPSRISTIRNPVVPFRTERVTVENNQYLCFVGRVEAEKGVEEAVRSADRVGMPMKIVGDGPLLEKIALEFPAVQCVGWCSREDVSKHIADARALIMPSRYPEPYGLVAVESSLSGIPILLSETAFLADEMAEAGLGFPVNPGDEASLDHALRMIKNMPEAEIRDISEKAFTGSLKMSTSLQEWVGALRSVYDRTVQQA